MAKIVNFKPLMEMRERVDEMCVISPLAMARRAILLACLDAKMDAVEIAQQSVPMFLDEGRRAVNNTITAANNFKRNWDGTDSNWFELVNSMTFDENCKASLSPEARDFCATMATFGLVSTSFQLKLFLCSKIRVANPALTAQAINNVPAQFRNNYIKYVQSCRQTPSTVDSLMSVLITSRKIAESPDYTLHAYKKRELDMQLRNLERVAFQKGLIEASPFRGPKADMLARCKELEALIKGGNSAAIEQQINSMRRQYENDTIKRNQLYKTALLPPVMRVLPVSSKVTDSELPRLSKELSEQLRILEQHQRK